MQYKINTMKKRILMMLAALLLCGAGTVRAQRTYVLAVGVAHYNDSNANLHHPDRDAIRVKSLMEQHYKDVTVMTSRYATHDAVLNKLREIGGQCKAEDRIVFFFSGHGFRGGLMAYDTFIRFDELLRELKRSNAGAKICLIDACKSGSLVTQDDSGKPSWAGLAGDSTMAFVVSCRAEELSIESPLVSAGLFTNALLKALRGLADTDGNKSITLDEMFTYLYGDIVKHSGGRQHPQLIATPRMRNEAFLAW